MLQQADPEPAYIAITYGVTVEIENETRPALLAEWLMRFYV